MRRRLQIHNSKLRTTRTAMIFLVLLGFFLSLFNINQAWSNDQTVPQRVISLAPHVTEMLFSAGAGNKMVGVVDYSDYPKAALKIESVGSYHVLNIEKIIQLNPDLIIAWKTGNRSKDIEKLQQLGYKIIYSEPYKLSDIAKEIRYFGQILQTQTTANKVANRLENKLATLSKANQNKPKVTAYYQIWNAPMMTINGKQTISQAMNVCGAQNIFADLPILAPEVSIESVIEKNPDTILLGGQKEVQQDWLNAWLKWPSINAVKKHHIYLLKADTFQRPTERLIEGIEGLCKKIDQVRATQ
jgi:iron complex transport system substrate-binding protein